MFRHFLPQLDRLFEDFPVIARKFSEKRLFCCDRIKAISKRCILVQKSNSGMMM